jgi:hypothetical protein
MEAERHWKHVDLNPASFLACCYGHQIVSRSVRNRRHLLGCASSIAVADWDSDGIPYTTETSRAQDNPDHLAC